MRPNFDAMSQIERETGKAPLQLAAAMMSEHRSLFDMQTVIYFCCRSGDKSNHPSREQIGAEIMDKGIANECLINPIGAMLKAIVKGLKEGAGDGEDSSTGE